MHTTAAQRHFKCIVNNPTTKSSKSLLVELYILHIHIISRSISFQLSIYRLSSATATLHLDRSLQLRASLAAVAWSGKCFSIVWAALMPYPYSKSFSRINQSTFLFSHRLSITHMCGKRKDCENIMLKLFQVWAAKITFHSRTRTFGTFSHFQRRAADNRRRWWGKETYEDLIFRKLSRVWWERRRWSFVEWLRGNSLKSFIIIIEINFAIFSALNKR